MVVGSDNKGLVGLKGSFMWRISLPLLLVLMAAGVAGLRDVQVTVPEAAAAGDTVTLHCKYDIEGDSLYSVKWYKGRQEFFRYIPKELPHTRVFPLDGVDVDVGRSGPGSVVLRGVTPSLSGRYRCEVSADSPSFHTAMKTSYMHVVELPESAPIILSEKSRPSVGDILRVRCTAPSAHPPANLTWILNGRSVPGIPISLDQDDQKPSMKNSYNFVKHHTRRELNKNNKREEIRPSEDNVNPYEPEGFRRQRTKLNEHVTKTYDAEEHSTFQSAVEKQGNDIFSDSRGEDEVAKRKSGSLLVIPVTLDVFQQGQLRIVCRAKVFSLYSAEAQLTLDEDKPKTALVLENQQTPNGAVARSASAVLSIFALLLKHLAS